MSVKKSRRTDARSPASSARSSTLIGLAFGVVYALATRAGMSKNGIRGSSSGWMLASIVVGGAATGYLWAALHPKEETRTVWRWSRGTTALLPLLLPVSFAIISDTSGTAAIISAIAMAAIGSLILTEIVR